MNSGVVIEPPADKDIGCLFRQESPETFPPEPCDPPDTGGAGGELPGEEIVEDHSEPPEED